nr:hypothetical protein [Tanacetum cinerariifolium]
MDLSTFYATRVTPPKKARKFKKPASPTLSTVSVSPEEPTSNSKRVKRPAKKSTNAPTAGVVIRETLVISLSKKKEMVIVKKHKGIDLLSKVALTKESQYEEVRKKCLRDFHKTHPSGSGTKNQLKVKLNLKEGMKMTTIMIMSQVIKAVIKRATVVMTIPNLTMKKCLILSMKLMRMNRVSNLIKRIMKKTLKMMKRKRMTILLKLRQDETNVKDKVKGHSLHASRPNRLCAQAQSGDDMPFRKQACTEYTRWVFYSGPIESGVKHLLSSVVWAMMSLDGSIVESLENVNGFLAMYTPSDDLIRIDFKKKGVVSEVMLHILEEFVFLLGRHSLNNEIPRIIVCKVDKPWGT